MLVLAVHLLPDGLEFITDSLTTTPEPAGGESALAEAIRQVRSAKPQGKPTWLTGPVADKGCALPATVLQPEDWAVLDLIEHDGEYAHLYAACTVKQATLVRARFRWPDGEVEFTVTDLEQTHGQ
jgi:hypothetical protein